MKPTARFQIAFILIVGIGLALIWLLRQPAEWRVSRQVVVNAPAGVLYPLISNFQTGWVLWQTDGFAISYQGPTSGLGAQRVVGQQTGWRDEIVSADRISGIGIRRHYYGDGAVHRVELKMNPDPRGVIVVSTLSGDSGWNLFFRWIPGSLENRYGPSLERDLNQLKETAESEWIANKPARPITF